MQTMQPILISDQEIDQSRSEVNLSTHVGNLFFGLLLGFLLLLFDRQPRVQPVAGHQRRRRRGWGRRLLAFAGIALLITLFIILLMGP